jgi:hypothetical protein
MRPNRKEPESAPFLFLSLSICCRPHGGLLQFGVDRPHGSLLHLISGRPHGGLLHWRANREQGSLLHFPNC